MPHRPGRILQEGRVGKGGLHKKGLSHPSSLAPGTQLRMRLRSKQGEKAQREKLQATTWNDSDCDLVPCNDDVPR